MISFEDNNLNLNVNIILTSIVSFLNLNSYYIVCFVDFDIDVGMNAFMQMDYHHYHYMKIYSWTIINQYSFIINIDYIYSNYSYSSFH